jgi:phosphonopyruvate decarboxylase
MVDPQAFFNALRARGFEFFTGVPDSLLKDFCAYVTDHSASSSHIIAANEGGAVALAAGHYLATGRPGVVYMQNSGQGNAVNPMTSLADADVFGIPMLLLVGWRGEPGTEDEPQHVKQGKVTLQLFETLGIGCEVLPESLDEAVAALDRASTALTRASMPYALVIRTGTFSGYRLKSELKTNYELNREGALRLIVDALGSDAIVVATTGKTSRELFELREAAGASHTADFRTVGCMGHASQIALGIALARPDRRVFCLDGDGAVIMQMGGLAIIGTQAPPNFRHIVINNGAHDSVGGQPTAGFALDLPQLALACGYRWARTASDRAEIESALTALAGAEGPALLELRVNKGARANLGRPTMTPAENKRELMAHLQS